LWGSGGYNFAGMPYYDTNTNTNPTMFRFYSQNIGRWHSPDPVGGDITNPQSLNRYAYVMNNPTSFTDPSGLGVCPPGTVWTSCNPEAAAQSNLGGLLGGLYNGWGVANMNEFVALEAAAMTAFLTQTSIHTMYQYQTISSDIGYFQPLDVANAPWEAMGAYSTATSVTGIQFAANNGLRAPDFVSINVNVGIPYLLNLVGPTFAINIGKNGHVYIGPGINVGKAWTLVSGSATANWMTQPNQMQSFLTKNSFSINGGYWGGVQGAWTPGSGVAGGVGFVSPQVGGAWTYSFDLGHWFGGW
jgi:RHS repeat-associated protein